MDHQKLLIPYVNDKKKEEKKEDRRNGKDKRKTWKRMNKKK